MIDWLFANLNCVVIEIYLKNAKCKYFTLWAGHLGALMWTIAHKMTASYAGAPKMCVAMLLRQ
jgi:hypothetical protein